ncbi:hypothetical protein CHU98_g4489 [Xylaria longipes]|nr:hypothetical protein CHU98_g4489 [Xylaria longipes]
MGEGINVCDGLAQKQAEMPSVVRSLSSRKLQEEVHHRSVTPPDIVLVNFSRLSLKYGGTSGPREAQY